MSFLNESYTSHLRPSFGLSVYNCGYQISGANHVFGPAVHGHYVIHYIINGKGKYYANNQVFELQKGDGFLIIPNQSTSYCADEDEPWEYYWVGFHGAEVPHLLKSAGIDEKTLIFNYDKDDKLKSILSDLFYTATRYPSRELAMIGYLYLFFSCITYLPHIQTKNFPETYLDKAVAYIQNNSSYKICVNDVAKYVGIERSYLYRIFKDALGCSVNTYIQTYKIEKAKNMLLQQNLSIQVISNSLGFEDCSHFTKVFKRITKQTPLSYKRDNSLLGEQIDVT